MTATIVFTLTVLILTAAWRSNRSTTTDVDKVLKRLSRRNDREIDKIKANFKPNSRYKELK